MVAFSDHQGRLVGKRTDGAFYLDVVTREGTENCDYLIACDLDDTPIQGFRWATFLFKEPYEVASAVGHRHLTPNSPYLEDYAICRRRRRRT